ncbi:MAG: hypothetical protein ACI86M_001739 [Saprospiraceae bacterium]|jgi:hypothetical protein
MLQTKIFSHIGRYLINVWVVNSYFQNSKNISEATYFGNNAFVNLRKAITSATYEKDKVFTNNYKQGSVFLDVTGGNQFMINNTINQNALNIVTKKPNTGYMKSGDGKLFIEAKNSTEQIKLDNCMNANLSENEIATSSISLFIDNTIGQQEHKGNKMGRKLIK